MPLADGIVETKINFSRGGGVNALGWIIIIISIVLSLVFLKRLWSKKMNKEVRMVDPIKTTLEEIKHELCSTGSIECVYSKEDGSHFQLIDSDRKLSVVICFGKLHETGESCLKYKIESDDLGAMIKTKLRLMELSKKRKIRLSIMY
jgi:hypothetical protein